MIDDWANMVCYDSSNPLMFNSGLFWVLFMMFIPFYGLLRHRKTAMVIYVILFSLYFYYKASGIFCILLLIRAVIDFYLSGFICKSDNRICRKILLSVSLFTSIGILAYFKYSGFIIFDWSSLICDNFNPADLILPVGISFYTFQSISYMVDVYKRRCKPAVSILDYLFYLSFFPTIVAGPIVRARDFLPQIRKEHRITDKVVFGGFFLIMIGLVKKMIIADYLAVYNNSVFASPSSFSGFECMVAVLGFSVQIFCDFSGYSDIAIGLGRILGFDLGKNFDSPYKSSNITDFWRRWHISLSSWLRDYVYIPLGGNRKGMVRMSMNIMITMIIGGIWHGAGWNFVVWGGLHGFGLVCHKIKLVYFSNRGKSRFLRLISVMMTFLFVTLLWIFFRATSLSDSLDMLNNILLNFRPELAIPFVASHKLLVFVLSLALALIFIPRRFFCALELLYLRSWWCVKLIIFIIIIQLIIEFSNSDVTPFIYSQF